MILAAFAAGRPTPPRSKNNGSALSVAASQPPTPGTSRRFAERSLCRSSLPLLYATASRLSTTRVEFTEAGGLLAHGPDQPKLTVRWETTWVAFQPERATCL